MPAPKIDVRFETEDFKRLLVAIQKSVDPIYLRTWAEGRAAPKAKEMFRQNFETRGGRLGKYWAGLAPSTQKKRAKLGFGPKTPPLVRTGKLKKEVVGHRPLIRTYPELEIEWGSNIGDKRYVWHQLGYQSRGPRAVPARPMIGFNKKDMHDLILSLNRSINAHIHLLHRGR